MNRIAWMMALLSVASATLAESRTVSNDALAGDPVALELPRGAPEWFNVVVPIEGVEFDLVLARHSVRAADCSARVYINGGYEDRPLPEPRTYRGHLADDPSVAVVAALTPSGLSATVHLDRNLAYRIEPVEGGLHSVSLGESFWEADEACGVLDAPGGLHPHTDHGDGRGGRASCVIRLAQLAFDADYEFYLAYGTVDNTIARIDQIVNEVNFYYARDVLIEHEIPAYVVRTSPFYAPTGGGDLLELFRVEWNTNQSHITRDIAHLMTGKPGDLIEYGGLAWVGVVCHGSYGYAWSMDGSNIVGHEVGHNWGAGHCHDTSPCNNMCGACFYVAPNTKEIIEGHRDSRSCLDEAVGFAVPVPPYAMPDSTTVRKSDLGPIAFDVLGNDHDANCDPLSIGAFDTESARGVTVYLSEGTGPDGRDELVYTPDTPLVGSDTFEYTVTDGTGYSASTRVIVDVRASRLHGYWRFDDASGTVAVDATPGERDGSLRGGASWTPGRFGHAVRLDGSSGSVRIPELGVQTDQATMTAWIRRDGDQADFAGVLFQRDNDANGLNIGTNNELRYHWAGAPSSYNWDSGLVLPDGRWVFAALVVEPDAATMYLYDDGIVSARNGTTHAEVVFDTPLHVGRDPANSNRFFRGEIDDARFYDYALTAEEIADLAEHGGRAAAPTPADGADLLDPADPLEWVSGPEATAHDVYLGQDFDAVASATRTSPEYKGSRDDTTYQPARPLPWGGDYFWRIDEQVPGATIKGDVWGFSSPDAWRWALDESSGTTAAEQILGLDGTYINGPTLGEPGAAPWTGQSIRLSQGADRVELPPMNLFGNHATITAWVRRDGVQSRAPGIVFSRHSSTVAGINLRERTNELGYHWNDDAATYGWESRLLLPDGQWALIALVVEPDHARMYLGIDGVLMSAVNPVAHGIEEFDGITHIGRDTATRAFRGWVDDVRVYDTALSTEQIEAIFIGADACPADLNADGTVDTQDFLAFLQAWAPGDAAADWNDDGAIDTQDFVAFLNDWAAGC